MAGAPHAPVPLPLARQILHLGAKAAERNGESAEDWLEAARVELPNAVAALPERELEAILQVVWRPLKRRRF